MHLVRRGEAGVYFPHLPQILTLDAFTRGTAIPGNT